MKKIIYFLSAIVVLTIIAVVIISNYTKQLPIEIKDTSCISDDGCVIVDKLDPQNPCCETCDAEAISKHAEIKRSEWYTKNCEDVQCPYYGCYSEKLPKPRCVNNQCEIEWIERPK